MPVFGSGAGLGTGLTSLALPLVMPVLPSFASIAVTMEDNIGVSTSPLDYSEQLFDWDSDRLGAKLTLSGAGFDVGGEQGADYDLRPSNGEVVSELLSREVRVNCFTF